MKKIIALLLVIALTAALSVSLTMAYLQDTDDDVNVMTLGNVYIEQNEYQRVEKNGEFTSELESYEQMKMLAPVTYPGNRTADPVTIGGYEITLSDDEANYVDKIVNVTNTGSIPAYVRTLVAIPTGGEDWEPNPVSANNCWLHWNILDGYNAYWTLNNTPVLTEINGVSCYVWEFVYNEALSSEKTTFPVIRGFYMDKRVSNDDNGYYMTYEDGTTKRINGIENKDGNLDVIVLSQAVQAAGFDNAQAAVNEAFGVANKENVTAWFSKIEPSITVVDNAEDLAAALNAGNYAVLTDDIENVDSDAYYGQASKLIDMTKGGTLDGNGNTIAANDEWDDTYDTVIYTAGGTIKNVTIDGAMRGVFSFGLKEDLILDNVIFNDVVYTVNDDATNGAAIIVRNSVLNGWTSWTSGHREVSFTNCDFGEGMGYAFINAHQSATFTNCDFAEGFKVNPANTSTYLTFVDCTYNGQPLTNNNIASLLYSANDAYLCIIENTTP